jgi:hypothetical protein
MSGRPPRVVLDLWFQRDKLTSAVRVTQGFVHDLWLSKAISDHWPLLMSVPLEGDWLVNRPSCSCRSG